MIGVRCVDDKSTCVDRGIDAVLREYRHSRGKLLSHSSEQTPLRGRDSPPAGQWRYFRNFVAYKKELITYEYG